MRVLSAALSCSRVCRLAGAPENAQNSALKSVAVVRRFYAVCLLLLLIVSLASANADGNRLNIHADQSTAVRFFYDPAGSNYFHTPLVFVVANDRDEQLNTAPALDAGRTAFIRLSEMKMLVDGLARLGLIWHTSPERVPFGPSIQLNQTGRMDITVISSKATAITGLNPKDICATLSSLDSALSTPRALWELQRFTASYHCPVSGFNPDAYPDHYYGPNVPHPTAPRL
jgi:hypothetical protein